VPIAGFKCASKEVRNTKGRKGNIFEGRGTKRGASSLQINRREGDVNSVLLKPVTGGTIRGNCALKRGKQPGIEGGEAAIETFAKKSEPDSIWEGSKDGKGVKRDRPLRTCMKYKGPDAFKKKESG